MAKKTSNTVWFASHPYSAPPKKLYGGNICLWNLRSSPTVEPPHYRKLLESSDAIVIDAHNRPHADQHITFVGEWECCSSYVPNTNKGIFGRTHSPICSLNDATVDCLNTDPYVFGKEFYWICCKQPNNKNQVHIGDIVLFGSYTLTAIAGKRKVDKMVIDTVLVVDSVIKLSNSISGSFTKCYTDVTIKHTVLPTYLFVGKMYDKTKDYQSNVPFSFVPCRRDGLMDKLVLDRHIPIAELGGMPFAIGQSGGHVDVNDNVVAWKAIVEHIRATGCELGVLMAEPPLITSNAIVNNAASKVTTPATSKPTTKTKSKPTTKTKSKNTTK